MDEIKVIDHLENLKAAYRKAVEELKCVNEIESEVDERLFLILQKKKDYLHDYIDYLISEIAYEMGG